MESLVCFDWSTLGPYCTKRNYCKWSVFSDPVTYYHIDRESDDMGRFCRERGGEGRGGGGEFTCTMVV